MRGSKSGVAKRISDIEPRALYTHCYGHSLNLAASDTIKKVKIMQDALDVTHEITKLIKISPRREGIFKRKKETLPGMCITGIRVLCPTRWTVRADALTSILQNFEALQETWEEAVEVVCDTETKARIRGVSAAMKTFDFLFGVMLGEIILRHTDNLSRTLQQRSISAAEGQQVAQMTFGTLKSLRNDLSYDLFWTKVNQTAFNLDVNEPQLPRRRKVPRRYDNGLSEGDHHDNPKSLYRQKYYEAIDLIVACIEDRFNQPSYAKYHLLDSLLIKACLHEEIESDVKIVCEFFHDDFDKDLLITLLQALGVQFQDHLAHISHVNVFDVKDYLTPGQLSLLSQVKRLTQLILVMPATNASSERSFSALRRVKSYLRSTMTQERLNHLMLIHVHKEKADSLHLKEVINEFVTFSDHGKGNLLSINL